MIGIASVPTLLCRLGSSRHCRAFEWRGQATPTPSVYLSPFLVITKMRHVTTDFNRLSTTYSYVGLHIKMSASCTFFVLLDSDYLLPRPCLPLNFLMGLALAPQTREQTKAARLEPAYGKRRRHELAAPLPVPWRERAKPLEGRAAEAGSFWCPCAVVCTFSYLQLPYL